MRSRFLVVVLALALSQTAFAGNDYFNAGKMVVGGQTGFSALGLGFGGNFEFGITNNFGIMPSIIIHNYSSGTVDWSFKVADLYGTYHYKPQGDALFGMFKADKLDTYGMAGISYVAFGASSASSSEETASNIAFGGGVGTRYYFSDRLSVFAEGKYRFATFKTNSYSLAISWYSIYLGLNFAIN